MVEQNKTQPNEVEKSDQIELADSFILVGYTPGNETTHTVPTVSVSCKSMELPDIIRCCYAAMAVLSRKALALAEQRPEIKDRIPQMRQDIFDMINYGASSLLAKEFPEIDMRPDLTAEAITEQENKIMAEHPEKVSEILAARGIFPHEPNRSERRHPTKGRKNA